MKDQGLVKPTNGGKRLVTITGLANYQYYQYLVRGPTENASLGAGKIAHAKNGTAEGLNTKKNKFCEHVM